MSRPVRWSIFNSNDEDNCLKIGDKQYDVRITEDSSLAIVDSSGNTLTLSELLNLGDQLNGDYQDIENYLLYVAQQLYISLGHDYTVIKNHSEKIVEFTINLTDEFPDLDKLMNRLREFVSSVSEKIVSNYVNMAQHDEGRRNHEEISSAFIEMISLSAFCQFLDEKIRVLRNNFKSVDEPIYQVVSKYPLLSGIFVIVDNPTPEQIASFNHDAADEQRRFDEESDEFKKIFNDNRDRAVDINFKREYILKCIERFQITKDHLNKNLVHFFSSPSGNLDVPEGSIPERNDKKLKDFEMLFSEFGKIIKAYTDKYAELCDVKKKDYDANISSKKKVLSTLSGALEHRFKELSCIRDSYVEKHKYLFKRFQSISQKASVLFTQEDNEFLSSYDSEFSEIESKISDVNNKITQLQQSKELVSKISNDFLTQNTKGHIRSFDLDFLRSDSKRYWETLVLDTHFEYPLHYLNVMFNERILEEIKERAKDPKLERLKERARLTDEKYDKMMTQRDTAAYDEDVVLDPKKAAARAAAIEANPLVQRVIESKPVGLLGKIKAKVAEIIDSKPLTAEFRDTITDAFGDLGARAHRVGSFIDDTETALQQMKDRNNRQNRGF